MSESIRDRVIQVLRRTLGPDGDLNHTGLDLQSLKMLEVVVGLENEFGVAIPEDAALGRITSSVDSIVAYVAKLQR